MQGTTEDDDDGIGVFLLLLFNSGTVSRPLVTTAVTVCYRWHGWGVDHGWRKWVNVSDSWGGDASQIFLRRQKRSKRTLPTGT